VRSQNVKLLEESIREKLHDFGFVNGFFNMSPKAHATKAKLIKQDYMKQKWFFTARKQTTD
jgi:hypothetical protein